MFLTPSTVWSDPAQPSSHHYVHPSREGEARRGPVNLLARWTRKGRNLIPHPPFPKKREGDSEREKKKREKASRGTVCHSSRPTRNADAELTKCASPGLYQRLRFLPTAFHTSDDCLRPCNTASSSMGFPRYAHTIPAPCHGSTIVSRDSSSAELLKTVRNGLRLPPPTEHHTLH